jgi:uncharacterized glyoxalase superfamily protein PhnB
MILDSATQPKQQVSINADAADAMPMPLGFSVDVGFPESFSEVHDRAKAEGYTTIEPLEDKTIGIRCFSLLDPSGTRVTIVAHLDSRTSTSTIAKGMGRFTQRQRRPVP